MRRREFIAGLGGAIALPVVAAAQPPLPVIGFLNGQSSAGFTHLVDAFLQGLQETGFVPDRNVRIEYRWAEGRSENLPLLAAELIERPVNLIVAAGGAHVIAKTATSSIPIVFTTGGEPVSEGLVTSFNRPGGNATGVSTRHSPPSPSLQTLSELPIAQSLPQSLPAGCRKKARPK